MQRKLRESCAFWQRIYFMLISWVFFCSREDKYRASIWGKTFGQMCCAYAIAESECLIVAHGPYLDHLPLLNMAQLINFCFLQIHFILFFVYSSRYKISVVLQTMQVSYPWACLFLSFDQISNQNNCLKLTFIAQTNVLRVFFLYCY